MVSGAALALIMSQWQPPPSSAGPPWTWLPILAALQILLGLTGTISGSRFLRLEPWTRRVLEVLTVVTIALVVGVNIFVGSMWTKAMGETVGPDLGPMRFFGVAVAVISTLIYGGGLVIMLHHLRSPEVREALKPQRSS